MEEFENLTLNKRSIDSIDFPSMTVVDTVNSDQPPTHTNDDSSSTHTTGDESPHINVDELPTHATTNDPTDGM